MNLAKALKVKNRLAGEIARLKERISTHNVSKNNQELPYNSKQELTALKEKVKELVRLKAAIAAANVPIYPLIFEMAELKGLVEHLKLLPVKEGGELEHVGFRSTEPVTVTYTSTIGRVELDGIVAQAEARIQELQDQLDEFNATTQITE